MGRDLDNALRLYRGFRDAEPRRVRKIRIPRTPKALMPLGYLRAVAYDTTQAFTARGYDHTWHPGSRPLLCTDGKRLYIVGGRFRVTSRGIVDLDSRGREEK